MLVSHGPNRVFLLVILAGLGTLVASQRRVVVHTAQDRDLRLTAHRLGLPVDRVAKGRQTLRKATRLVGEVTGEESVSVLAKLWISPAQPSNSLTRGLRPSGSAFTGQLRF